MTKQKLLRVEAELLRLIDEAQKARRGVTDPDVLEQLVEIEATSFEKMKQLRKLLDQQAP